jgi:hypothetical protein
LGWIKKMTLSKFSMFLGVVIAIPQVWALLKPAQCSESLRKFPRSEMWGYALMAIGASWFLYNVNREAIAEFAAYKTHMLVGFGSVAVLSCLFVPDYLAVRGLCVTMLMLASYTLSLTRWADSPWRLLLVVGAYIWIVVSMWWMISPWRMRDFLNWLTARPERLRMFAIVRLVFAVALIVLGATAFRS